MAGTSSVLAQWGESSPQVCCEQQQGHCQGQQELVDQAVLRCTQGQIQDLL